MSSEAANEWDFRTFLALLMATIATFGAFTAYRAAVAEDDAAGATRLLDEGQILELDKRQRYLDDIALGVSYQRQADGLRAQARARGSTPLDRLQAQEDLAASRIARRYADYYTWNLSDYSLEGELERWTADDLGDLGFVVTWVPDFNRGKIEPDIWRDQRAEVGGLGSELVLLTAGVVFFVLALLCLTVADIASASRRRLWLALAALATVCAEAVVLVRVHDAVTVACALAGSAVLAWLFVKLFSMCEPQERPAREPGDEPERGLRERAARWLRALAVPGAEDASDEYDKPAAELEPTGYIGSRVLSRSVHGTFSRFVVVAIAITALCSAFCGYLYSRAAENMNRASSAAVNDQAGAFRESTRSRVVANWLVGSVERLQEDQARADAAAQALQLATENAVRAPAFEIASESTLRRTIYDADLKALVDAKDATTAGLLVDPADPASVLADPGFPSRLVEDRASASSDRAFAMWDADNQLSLAYQRKMSLYLAGLTLFAISLYLFGQSMGIEGFLATRILALAAAIFALVGATTTIWNAVRPELPPHGTVSARSDALPAECRDIFKSYETDAPDPEHRAAAHYACGRHLESMARTPDDFRNAAMQFAIATTYRPGFALARAAYAAMYARIASAQRTADYPSLPAHNIRAIATTVDQERAAVEQLHDQGFDNPHLLVNLGYDLYLLGLLTSDKAKVEEASGFVDRGLDAYRRYDRVQGWAAMNGALVLAARGRIAEAQTAYADLAADPNVLTTAPMALGGLTDLEFLRSQCRRLLDAAQCGALAAALPQLKATIVSAVPAWRSAAPAASPPAAAPSVAADFAQVTPGAAAWHARVTGGGASGLALLAVWYYWDPVWRVWVAQPQLLGDPRIVGADATASAFSAALSGDDFAACNDAGTYRVEFYLQGSLAGQSTAQNAADGYQAAFDPRLDLALCVPPGWKRERQPARDGSLAWFRAPDGHSGILLARRDDPGAADANAAQRIAAVELAALFGAPVRYGPAQACAGSAAWRRDWYAVAGRSVLAQTMADGEGGIYEGFFIASGSQPEPEQCAAADSLAAFP